MITPTTRFSSADSSAVQKHYEEILTSLDFTFGEIREHAERILKPDHPYDAAVKRAANIIGLIDSRSKY